MNINVRLIASALITSATLAFTGCKTAPGTLTKSAISGAVSGSVSIGLWKYPQAEPEVRIAETVICSAANSTNVQPTQIVDALEKAGITNDSSKFILNGVVAIYNGVFTSYGDAWIQNQPALQGYLSAVCDGMTAALPPNAPGKFSVKLLPPHLK